MITDRQRQSQHLLSRKEALQTCAELCYSVPIPTVDTIEQKGRDRARMAIHDAIFELQEKLNNEIAEFLNGDK